ncbi:MAG: hypothetical protein A2W61_00650 [Deltaproteobacteria bacterium RIFCSPLOWO2_01_44_7]|nr:MAG: hypothetical protein A2712_06000 [Deltaproteobacteria bacterium RIFCSPHIGHO2_01_FULL_43_49]OGQ16683.1 MAG: hypothetical protein A3D22_07125 [Deltaproteobacteria bacterium RIFCSPHIGHO2_02_FULL_44_53]OGQ29821.1 MAG: hypothetical protein A3D98_09790 [Deltaproteobacteria bacterium RIFCSPHIGHO2_12_FULL_44_21]OGQ33111.1 MAG: hypothetical protein A2979_03770 [Deltaproteobacteria bacterium RIFCSPLOWO2_01_FULL_45_74]OGQ39606.1 MAG: hypothetical protein A2W61_00650 [Deltaproteobacteria bacterium 
MFRKNVECRPLKNISTWRKISLATWEKPGDPSSYGEMEIDMTKALALLEKLKTESNEKLTITHFIVKGVAKMLAEFPDTNVIIRRNKIYLRDNVDVFVQVFWQEKGRPDLSGAKIRDAHKKTLDQIADELNQQTQKIRAGDDPNLKQSKMSLKFLPPFLLKWVMKCLAYIGYDLNLSPFFLKLPPDPFGGAMITNVGMFGIKTAWAPLVPFSRTPIVFVVGVITDQAVVENGQVVVKPIVHITATVDHRIVDGYLAGKAGGYLKNLLENPEQLL